MLKTIDDIYLICVSIFNSVFFLQKLMTTVYGKRLTEIVNDIADVQFDDIIAKLEAPKKKTDGNNMSHRIFGNY